MLFFCFFFFSASFSIVASLAVVAVGNDERFFDFLLDELTVASASAAAATSGSDFRRMDDASSTTVAALAAPAEMVGTALAAPGPPLAAGPSMKTCLCGGQLHVLHSCDADLFWVRGYRRGSTKQSAHLDFVQELVFDTQRARAALSAVNAFHVAHFCQRDQKHSMGAVSTFTIKLSALAGRRAAQLQPQPQQCVWNKMFVRLFNES